MTESQPTEGRDIIERINGACIGHPFARIAWPHRLLHDARAEIERLRETEAQRDKLLRHLIDLTWGEAFEDQSVPSTAIQDRIIRRALEGGKS